jgi:hypothetical protein
VAVEEKLVLVAVEVQKSRPVVEIGKISHPRRDYWKL